MVEEITLEQAVARFVVGFKFSDIDTRTLASLKTLIKDQFAIMVGASQLPWSKQTRAFRDPRPGKSTLVAEASRAAAIDAAYINASYGHGFEYDDFYGNAHPGCAVVPAAFALGEELGATLEQTITALVVGYETYVRLGKHGSPEILRVGWQPHAVFANFGAAALASKIYGLDETQTFHALAIALSHASGPTEYASTGGSVKRVHAGIAVRNGIEAAQLARAGLTGPRRFLTGDRGLFRLFCHKTVGAEANADFMPGVANFMPGLSLKPYCCCAATFAYIEAMERFAARVDEIAHVDAYIQTMTDSIVGTRNAQLYHPRNIEELQYSLPVQMALAALGVGNGYRTHRAFLDGRIDLSENSQILQFARRIKLKVAKELDEQYRFFVADVTVHFKNGASERYFQERAKGSPIKPFTAEFFQVKLDELTQDVIGPRQAIELFAAVDEMRPDGSAAQMMSLLSR